MSINIVTRISGADASLGARAGIVVHNPKMTDPLAGLMVMRLEADQITGVSNNDPTGTTWPNTGTDATKTMTQADSSKQGLWQASDANFNGKPSVFFDDVQMGMLSNLNLTAAEGYTIIMVVRSVATSSRQLQSGTNNCVMSSSRNAFAVFNGTVVTGNTEVINHSHPCILTLAVGAQSKCYNNGVDVTDSTTGLNDWGTLAIGAAGSQAEAANAYIAAIGAFIGVDDTKRQLIESTWKAKYGTP